MFYPALSRAWMEAHLNPLAQQLEQARQTGSQPIDLIGANPHENGLEFAETAVRAAIEKALDKVRVYRPHPRGQEAARQAVAAYYQRRGLVMDAANIVLTPGTSMAYLYAFRLLVESGGEVLVPSPGYPLFDDLCAFAGIGMRYYHLRPDASGYWRPDLEDLEFQCTPRTRAVVVVSPHNPLGTVFSPDELRALAEICQKKHLSVLFDEVFSEFLTDASGHLPRPAADQFPLLLTLNGFSKMLSLPGHKVGWIAMGGQHAEVGRFMRALEYASDLFLPVSELAQAAVPDLLALGDGPVSGAMAAEYRERRRLAAVELGDYLQPAEGGVYLCVQLPRSADDDAVCLQALAEEQIVVHPGHFYRLDGYLVLTATPRPAVLQEGTRRLRRLLIKLEKAGGTLVPDR